MFEVYGRVPPRVVRPVFDVLGCWRSRIGVGVCQGLANYRPRA